MQIAMLVVFTVLMLTILFVVIKQRGQGGKFT